MILTKVPHPAGLVCAVNINDKDNLCCLSATKEPQCILFPNHSPQRPGLPLLLSLRTSLIFLVAL